MRPKNTVAVLIGQNFHKAVGGKVGFGAAIAHEHKLAHFVGAAFVFQRLFGLADRSNFGVGIDHTGDHIVIHMAMTPGNNLGCGNAFIFCLMGQHWPVNGITDGVNAAD